MTVWIEDSPRNLVSWIEDSISQAAVAGAVITPFASPYTKSAPTTKRGAVEAISALLLPGRQVWFDPMTHALQMSNVGDFRYYDGYNLWPAGSRGDLSTPKKIEGHITRIFEVQSDLGVPHLAPTVLLNAPLSDRSVLALDIARMAMRIDSSCALSIAGTASFWSGGNDLDAHIGSQAALEAQGWFLSVVRPTIATPVAADSDDIFGLCRTARALSEDAMVHVSHGDLAALPAIAAGATSIGSGWDQRQRQCAQTDYSVRDDSNNGGGGWFTRPLLRGLLGLLYRSEADVLGSRKPELMARLGGIPAPGPKENFLHHVEILGSLTHELRRERNYRRRYILLDDLYKSALADWPAVQSVTRCTTAGTEWITPFRDGLTKYAASEGWSTD